MRKSLFIGTLLFVPLLLTGCFKTQTLAEEDKVLPEITSAFDRTEISIDYDNSYFSFVGKKDTTKNHQSEFENYEVTINLDDNEPSNLEKAQVEVSVDINSMKTDSEMLTGHLLDERFFDAINNPTATFSSSSIVKVGDDQYEVTGDVTIRGVSQEITLDAEITNEYALITHDLIRTPYGVGAEDVADADVPLEIKLMFQ